MTSFDAPFEKEITKIYVHIEKRIQQNKKIPVRLVNRNPLVIGTVKLP